MIYEHHDHEVFEDYVHYTQDEKVLQHKNELTELKNYEKNSIYESNYLCVIRELESRCLENHDRLYDLFNKDEKYNELVQTKISGSLNRLIAMQLDHRRLLKEYQYFSENMSVYNNSFVKCKVNVEKFIRKSKTRNLTNQEKFNLNRDYEYIVKTVIDNFRRYRRAKKLCLLK